MQPHLHVALVTLLALIVYLWMGISVGGARRKTGIAAPAMTGDPLLERHIRAHYNTLESLPVFLASMWLFAIYWNDLVAAGLGVIWIVGRILYFRGYVQDASKRELGFIVQVVATLALLLGALGRVIYVMAVVG